MFIPVMQRMGRKLGVSPSKLLIPLSYSVIIGGTICLIGTSTNLVVQGLAEEKDPTISLTIFSLAPLGIPCLLGGIIFIMFIARYIPDRVNIATSLDNPRDYIVCMVVKAAGDGRDGGVLVGKTLGQTTLLNTSDLNLVRIERVDGTSVTAPGPGDALCANDRLLFTGTANTLMVLSAVRGLRAESEKEVMRRLSVWLIR
jgi:di/tricarboxylate transporter